MKRAALLHCVDIDLMRYKLLRQRDQLPFTPEATDPVQAPYNLDHAFRLRLMLDVIADKEAAVNGLGPTFAATMINNAVTKLERHPLNHLGAEDTWLGVVVFEEPDGEGTFRRSAWFAGQLADLGSFIAEEQAKFRSDFDGECQPIRIFVGNASRAARFVRQRAFDLGLPEAEQFG